MQSIQTLLQLLAEIKTWLLSGVAIVTVLAVLKDFYNYQGGGSGKKQEAMESLKSHLRMGVGIFIVISLATYAVGKFHV